MFCLSSCKYWMGLDSKQLYPFDWTESLAEFDIAGFLEEARLCERIENVRFRSTKEMDDYFREHAWDD